MLNWYQHDDLMTNEYENIFLNHMKTYCFIVHLTKHIDGD